MNGPLRELDITLEELRPGIDGVALVRRHHLGRPAKAKVWFESSPLNEEIDRTYKDARKLLVTGVLFFRGRRA